MSRLVYRSLVILSSCTAVSMLITAIADSLMSDKVSGFQVMMSVGVLCAFLAIMFTLFIIIDKMEEKKG